MVCPAIIPFELRDLNHRVAIVAILKDTEGKIHLVIASAIARQHGVDDRRSIEGHADILTEAARAVSCDQVRALVAILEGERAILGCPDKA